jgi:hypothetical protein
MYNPIKLQKIAFNIYNYNFTLLIQYNRNRIGGVIVSVLFSSAVDRGFEPRWGQTKAYKIGICCFSAKDTAIRRKYKYWLTLNQNNVSKCTWSDMSYPKTVVSVI